jgi:phenylalanyl-tRNA synthetase beta subunit
LPNTYSPLSRYPGTERDICFQVANDVTYAQIIHSIQTALSQVELETTVTPVDIYQANDSSTKNVTVRIKLTAHDRTLAGEDVTTIIKQVSGRVTDDLHATVV